MTTYKKLLLGLGLVIAAATTFGVSSIVSPSSVLALDKQPDRFYYDSCVDLVGPNNRGLTNCTFFDDRKLTRPDLLFGKGDFEVSFITAEALYHVPYDVDRFSKPPPPSWVSILDKDAKSISVNGNALGGRFGYSGQSFTSPGYDIPYYLYSNIADPDYVILVALKSNGDLPLILAMVNKKVQDDPRGDSRGTVYAYEINKVATGSTTTGTPIITPVTPPPSDTGTDAACYASGWSLGWLACPMITAAQTTANAMYGFVEDQLKFTVSQDNKTQDSLGSPETRKGVHDVWSNFRILVSGLVVILLLVMVISQAIGSGPFDAYTVKKMLPRLVIGVILIQISWPLFSWVINTVDDLGRGLAELMYAPFGGAKSLDLYSVLSPFGQEAVTFNWVGIGAMIIFGVVAPFVVLGLILAVLAALFFGFLTLLFRKIIIILALIVVPVALISWMMPNDGLRIYWKKWWENFSKALMMYPLIIAIIAGGRIFAKIGSGGHDFVGFFIVLVGFFGPLFILPKTFKWGGTVMTMAGNGISKAQERGLKKPQEYLKKQQEGYSALRDARSSFRYSNPNEYKKNAWARTASLWRRPIDSFKAGKLNPLLGTPGSELRARQRTAFVARGDKYEREQNEEAGILREKIENRLNEDDPRGGNKDDMYQDMLRVARGEAPRKRYYDTEGKPMDLDKLIGIGRFSGSRNKKIMRRAALDRMAELGAGTNWRHIEAEHERINALTGPGAAEEKTAWRKFLNDNKTQVLEKMPDLLKGVGSVSDISAEGISRMHGIGIERMLSKNHADATEGIREGESEVQFRGRQETGQARLTKFLSTYNEALNNSNLRGNLEQNGLRAVKAFVTSTPAYREEILYKAPARVHSDDEDGREEIRERTTPDGQYDVGSRVLLSPLIGTDDHGVLTPASQTVVNNIPQTLRDSLDTEINVDGSFKPPPRRDRGGEEDEEVPSEPPPPPPPVAIPPPPPPGGNVEPEGIVIARTYGPQAPREGPEEPPAGSPGSPPSLPPSGDSGGTEGEVEIPHDTPPEDFGPEGRFPPPNIPPGPGNV